MNAGSNPLVAPVETLAPLILGQREAADREGRLQTAVVEAFQAAGLVGVWAPRSLGGLEATPRAGMEMIEAVARLDGSTAWNLFIWATVAPVFSFLSEAGIDEVFSGGGNVIGAGAQNPPGEAVVVEGGYRVSGRWPFASGSAHATWFTGGCLVTEGGSPRMTSAGGPEVRAVVFPAGDVQIIDTWQVSGLRGTGSNDIAVQGLFVPEHRTFIFGGAAGRGRHFQGALYRFPLYGIIGTPLAMIALGIAQAAVDEFAASASTRSPRGSASALRESAVVQAEFAKATATIKSARAWLLQSVDDIWRMAESGQPIPTEDRIELALASTHATRGAAQAVDTIQSLAGAAAVYRSSGIERAFRDIHAATQHAITGRRNFEGAGRVLLGLPPDSPLLLV